MITAKYFTEREFQRCSPPCSLQDMSQALMLRLDNVRRMAGIPLVINSAFRSIAYEKSRGRSGTSSHCKGLAVDIRCNSDANRWKIVKALIDNGFTRIGISKTYIHADIDTNKTQGVIWHYYG